MAWAELADGVSAALRAAEVCEAAGDLWDLTGVLAFAEYQRGTLARPEPTAAHAARLTGLAERVAPMAEHLGHLGAEFLVVASRIRIEGIYRADLAFIERMGRHVVEICERGGLPWLYVGHLYRGLAAHWRDDWETAERELRLADRLEAPGAVGGQSAAHLALHLAHAGRGDEVAAVVEAHRPGFPVAGVTSSIGAWNMLLGFVEALAVAGRPDEVAALRPLLDEALALDDWISFDGRLVATRAAIAATAARDWDAAERHFATTLATPRPSATASSRPTSASGGPACWVTATARATGRRPPPSPPTWPAATATSASRGAGPRRRRGRCPRGRPAGAMMRAHG